VGGEWLSLCWLEEQAGPGGTCAGTNRDGAEEPTGGFCVTRAGGAFDTASVLLGQCEWQQELPLLLFWMSYIWIWGAELSTG
jgi:hypothetical protein